MSLTTRAARASDDAALSARALGDDAAGARYEARRSAATGVLERAG